MDKHHFDRMAELLTVLLSSLQAKLLPKDVEEIKDFLENNEFGLALESLVASIQERGRIIAYDDLTLIEELSNMMGLEENIAIARACVK